MRRPALKRACQRWPPQKRTPYAFPSVELQREASMDRRKAMQLVRVLAFPSGISQSGIWFFIC